MSAIEGAFQSESGLATGTSNEEVIQVGRSSKAEVSVQERAEKKRRKKVVLWNVFKKIVFIIFLICLTIQFKAFHHIYSKYPTRIVPSYTDKNIFKIPAVTICFRNTISAKTFCRDYPHFCEKPSNLTAFCLRNPVYCRGDITNLTIPLNAYKKNYSSIIDDILQSHLLQDAPDDPELFKSYGGTSKSRTFTKFENKYFKCYSDNLHLYKSDSTQETKEIGFYKTKLYASYGLRLYKTGLFYPLGKPQAFLGIHSPYEPMNPVTDGHPIKQGHYYKIPVQLVEEEHLLPPPYQTNCFDYVSSKAVEKFQGPNSRQMCLELCEVEFSMESFKCADGLTMYSSNKDLCLGDVETTISHYNISEKCEKSFLNCVQSCRPDCLKLNYEYKIVEREMEDMEELNAIKGESIIEVYIKNTRETILRHVPLYDRGELFGYICGLLGYCLCVSVLSFTEVFEHSFQKTVKLCPKFETKDARQLPTPEDPE